MKKEKKMTEEKKTSQETSELVGAIKLFGKAKLKELKMSLIYAIATMSVASNTTKEEFSQALYFLLRVGNANNKEAVDVRFQAKARTCLVRHVLEYFPMDWCPDEVKLACLEFFQWDHRHVPFSNKEDMKRLRNFIRGYKDYLGSLATTSGVKQAELSQIWVETLVFLGDYDFLVKEQISSAVPMIYNQIIRNCSALEYCGVPDSVELKIGSWKDHEGPFFREVMVLGHCLERNKQRSVPNIKEAFNAMMNIIWALSPNEWKE